MKLIKMPSIEQFRNIIKNISHTARFAGLDKDNNPIYNFSPLPVLKAKGTIKLHGTNASICYNINDGLWVQSKENIITPIKDNAGFAFFVESNKNIFIDLMNIVYEKYSLDNTNTITIYGEWAGKGIQKNVGISEVDKKFYIFGIKITPSTDEPAYWVDSNIFDLSSYDNIYHIEFFGIFDIVIDFNNPLLSNNKMVAMVQEVESRCPVANYFGIDGVGEGIVFEIKFADNIFRWKMKGDKHAGKSKVKIAKNIDDEKLQLIIDTVEKVTPEWRLEQMYQETFDTLNDGKGDIKKTGDYIRAIVNDIIKEEMMILSELNLAPKDINSAVAKKAKLWFMKRLDEESGMV